MKPRIASAVLVNGSVHLRWQGDETASLHLPLIWLRDHCPCTRCLHPQTLQRQLESHEIPDDPSAQLQADADAVIVTWIDEGHQSRFSASWLAALGQTPSPPVRLLWDRHQLEADPPTVSFAAVMADDTGVRRWLEDLERFGLGFVSDVPVTTTDTQALAERLTYIRHTIFGGFWDFTSDFAYNDTAYTNLAIGPHTDGTYCFDAPGAQMFHCLRFDGTGGESTFVDAFRIAEIMRQDHPDAFRLLCETPITGQYLDPERGIHLRATRPLFRLDAAGTLIQVSFNSYDRAPFLRSEREIRDFYRALRIFTQLARDPALVYRLRLSPGNVVLFNNWRVLHGRDAFEGERRLCGVYINQEDIESRLRALRDQDARHLPDPVLQ